VQEVNFVKEHRCLAFCCGNLRSMNPKPLPEAGERSLRAIRCRVQRFPSRRLGKLEQERRLADLSRAGEQLDPRWWRFSESLHEQSAALPVAEAEIAGHVRIIIRL